MLAFYAIPANISKTPIKNKTKAKDNGKKIFQHNLIN
jgi:hypothetical protein